MISPRKRHFISVGSAVLAFAMLTSCGSNTGSETSASKASLLWLKSWSGTEEKLAFSAYEGFEQARDSFTKESFLDLPKSQLAPVPENKPFFRWSMYSGEESQGRYQPLLIVGYLGDEWQFFNSVMVRFGEEVIELQQLNEPDRDTSGGSITEILSFALTAEDVEFLSQIFTKGSPQIRINGEKTFYTDVTLSEIELKNLEKVLLAYKYIAINDIRPSEVSLRE